MKRLAIIGLLIIVFACGRRSYRFSNAFEKGVPAGLEKIHLDDSYALYRREVFKDKDPVVDRFTMRQNKALSNEPDKLIEVEYLLISNFHKNAIYITTIPDARQVYFAENSFSEDTVNIQDFNTFHFGKIVDTTEIQFLFPDMHRSNTWEAYQEIDNSQTLSIKRLTHKVDGVHHSEMRADLALADTVEFQRVGKFTLLLSKPKKKEEERKVIPSRDNIIYIQAKRSGHRVFFRLNEPVHKKDSTVVFPAKFVRHTPKPLLED